MSRKYQTQQFIDPKGALIEDSRGDAILVVADTTPTNSQSGYAVGCIYLNRAGGASTIIYVNRGSRTSTTWFNIA